MTAATILALPEADREATADRQRRKSWYHWHARVRHWHFDDGSMLVHSGDVWRLGSEEDRAREQPSSLDWRGGDL